MAKYVICTAGTSVANKVPFPEKNNKPEEHIWAKIEASVQEQLQNTPDIRRFLVSVSAETNSLQALNLESSDRVVLLHTETPDGRACAKMVKKLIEGHISCHVELKEIEGLQVVDPDRFKRVGIPELFRNLDHHITAARDFEVILNTTGGFKGVVPYVTLFGLIKGISTYYLFEFSNSLIQLPPLPLVFDVRKVARAYDVLRYIEGKTAIPRKDYYNRIVGFDESEREWFDSLVEDAPRGEVTLSPFAFLCFQKVEAGYGNVYISPRASRVYADSSATTKEQYGFMLNRVRDPMWRQQHIHAFSGTDLKVYKPGSTSERLAGILQGRDVYVCELYPHDEYELNLPGRRASDYDLSTFTIIQPLDDVSDETITMNLYDYRGLQERDKREEQEKSMMQNRIRSLEDKLEASRKELERLRNSVKG